ncbi:TspO/MBR family protein [Pseudarthrobacter enclensis]|uniref:TspO protein n=1 Tax=Pseudarthrobacter enclensis TaxID=993070 RepID=A0A0V8I6C1_9MICC|nr:TspO/MBR family protein [Pseudarthrobacter enclensis]KSU70348.1 TspO protein [Pseudarthrobacter enclensis]BCW18186.1 putative TspO/MBR-related protein precursor [Arthrobacter sp. NtRootA9]SCC27434.1 TspO and MBR related proteins [Pseudarthrobacter enclensis]
MEPNPGHQTVQETPQSRPYRTGVQVAALAGFLAASFLVAALGGTASANNVDGWYTTADKAPWTPPNFVFGPVWTVLYTAMAVAAWLVWRRRTDRTRPAMVAYAVQLVLNLAWTPMFFGLYPALGTAALWLSLVIIVALIAAVVVTVLYFGPVSRTAGLLLLPYVAWLVYATTLNAWAAFNN